MKLTLYHYWRSSSSWRARLVLAAKKISVEYVHVDLLSGEQRSAEHKARNPLGLVPSLKVEDGGNIRFINDSLAIAEFLEEIFPQIPLLPVNPYDRARVREMANLVASGIQPLQNLRVLNAISQESEAKSAWARQWIIPGFEALEKIVSDVGDGFCFGNTFTIADAFFLPQAYSADRFQVSWDLFPELKAVHMRLKNLDIGIATAPEKFEPKK